ASCALNLTLGTLLLVRPSVRLYFVQAGAVVGYTLTAAFNVPELTIDHCAPLVKNLPVLACVMVLWLAEAGRPSRRAEARSATPKGQAVAAVTTISTRHSGRASRASTVARGGACPAGTQASHAAFMPAK